MSHSGHRHPGFLQARQQHQPHANGGGRLGARINPISVPVVEPVSNARNTHRSDQPVKEKIIWIKELHRDCRATVYTGSAGATKEVQFSSQADPKLPSPGADWEHCDVDALYLEVQAHPPLMVKFNNGQPRNPGRALWDFTKSPSSRGKVPILPDHVLLLQSGQYHVYKRHRPGHSGSPRNLVKKTVKTTAEGFGKALLRLPEALLG